jgi:electron transport complex protein RnfD
MMRDVLFALSVLLIPNVAHYGLRPLVMAGLTMLVCVFCELLFHLIQGKSIHISEYSAMVTGMIIVMLMPLNAPMWVPCIAAAFAIFVAKGPFGGIGNTPFNPAAAGVAFVTLCFPKDVFSYFNPNTAWILPAFGKTTVSLADSPAAVLKGGLRPDIFPLNMLWGVFAGPVGTTAILVIASCALFLIVRRTASWEIIVCFIAAAALIAALFPRFSGDWLTSVKYEMMAGSLLFCAVFIITDPVTSPNTARGRCIYGALAGALTMMFRYFGAFEEGTVFAVLIANAAAPLIDGMLCSALRIGGGLSEE